MHADVYEAFAAAFFPKRCPFCKARIHWKLRCCPACEAALPFAESGFFQPDAYGSLDGVYAPFFYEPPVSDAIRRLKFSGQTAIARHLAPYMWEALPEELLFDALIPIPMESGRMRERGYNQAFLLARFICKSTGIPVVDALKKVRRTKPQHSLRRKERRENLVDAYEIKKSAFRLFAQGKTLLLCDDVTTTGATFAEAAAVLKKAGAKAVYALAAAFTPETSNQNSEI